MAAKRNGKKKAGNIIPLILFVLIGAACGVIVALCMERSGGDLPLYDFLLVLIGIVLEMYAAIFLQLIIHEAGHLVFGLLTGYRFSSFRIGSLMFMKRDGKLHTARLSVAGTGGQCLMLPPETEPDRVPVVLYNLGGAIMNLFSAALFAGLYFLCTGVQLLWMFCLIMCVVGVGIAFMNGVPLHLGTVNNDGSNALETAKSPEAKRAFVIQMRVAGQSASGVRLKDMPEEWFALPKDWDKNSSLTAALAVFRANRLMDMHRFDEAAEAADELLCGENGVVGLYRGLLRCDRVYCALISEGRNADVSRLFGREQKALMKQMRNFPSVIRTEYAYALLYEKDAEKAEKKKSAFEAAAKRYPYESDIESERELMQTAEEAAAR